MGRSGTNVVGNAVASTVIARWEGVLKAEKSPDIEPRPAPAHVQRTGEIHDHF
jgi:Na+/H+-dicarboxylate symporter